MFKHLEWINHTPSQAWSRFESVAVALRKAIHHATTRLQSKVPLVSYHRGHIRSLFFATVLTQATSVS